MTGVQVKIEGLKRAQRQMSQMSEAGKDVRPIWEGFLEAFKVYIDEKWSEQGRPFGKRWQGYKKNPDTGVSRYAQWKRQVTGSGRVDLILTGRLKRAATGSRADGYFQELKQVSASWGIRGIPYAAIHQFGGNTGRANMPQRPYFMTTDGLLPGELMQALFDVTNAYFEENM